MATPIDSLVRAPRSQARAVLDFLRVSAAAGSHGRLSLTPIDGMESTARIEFGGKFFIVAVAEEEPS